MSQNGEHLRLLQDVQEVPWQEIDYEVAVQKLADFLNQLDPQFIHILNDFFQQTSQSLRKTFENNELSTQEQEDVFALLDDDICLIEALFEAFQVIKERFQYQVVNGERQAVSMHLLQAVDSDHTTVVNEFMMADAIEHEGIDPSQILDSESEKAAHREVLAMAWLFRSVGMARNVRKRITQV